MRRLKSAISPGTYRPSMTRKSLPQAFAFTKGITPTDDVIPAAPGPRESRFRAEKTASWLAAPVSAPCVFPPDQTEAEHVAGFRQPGRSPSGRGYTPGRD